MMEASIQDLLGVRGIKRKFRKNSITGDTKTLATSSSGPLESIVTCGFEDLPWAIEAEGSSTPSFRYLRKAQLIATWLSYLPARGDDVILTYHDIDLRRNDLRCLQEKEWLNDSVISFIFKYVERCLSLEAGDDISAQIVLVLPSMSYLLMHHSNPKELHGVLPDVGQYEYIFLPVNDNSDPSAPEDGTHWSLIVVCRRQKLILHYDTVHDTFTEAGLKPAEAVNEFLSTTFELVNVCTTKQANGHDCGILICEICAFLGRRALISQRKGFEPVDLSLDNVALVASAGRGTFSRRF